MVGPLRNTIWSGGVAPSDIFSNCFGLIPMADAGTSSSSEFRVGARIRVGDAAGPRLASKHGTVLGHGKYRDAVRVKLDSSKFPITLHKKYLSLEAQS